MSSTAAPGGATVAAPPQRYFCHQCDRTVTLTPSPTGDLSCPICHGGFLEEFDIPNPNRNPNPFFSFPASAEPFFPSSSALPFPFSYSFDLRNPSDLTGLLGGGPDRSSFFRSSSSPAGPEPFNPFAFLQNYFQSVMADGTNIQVVFEGAGGSPLTGNLGDYFIGPGLEQFIQQLVDNDPNRYGTPPAAESAVDSLPDVKISDVKISDDRLHFDDEAWCAVCKDAFEMGAEAKKMPCEHFYHKDCIIPWLKLHNTCPVCRYELPTDDPDYENKRGGAQGLASAVERTAIGGDLVGTGVAMAAAGGEGNSPGGTGTMERRFRISLPWPFRTMGSGAETSNTGDGGNNSGGSGGGRDGGSGGRRDPGSETQQEDLD